VLVLLPVSFAAAEDKIATEEGTETETVSGPVAKTIDEMNAMLSDSASVTNMIDEPFYENVKDEDTALEAIANGEMATQLPWNGTPTTYFLDGEGLVLDYPISGIIPEDYIAALEDYLNGKTTEFQALLKQKVDAQETSAKIEGDQTYTVVFVDEEGNPVPEVMAAFCTADKCNQTESDEEGKCTYTGPADTYHVTIVEVPEGFKDDYGDDVYTERMGSSITIVLKRE